jgi:hypothetical protein
MRNRRWLIAVSATLLSLSVAAAGVPATTQAAAMRVAAVTGSATVTRADGAKVTAAPGLALAVGDLVDVGPGGQVDLTLGPGNTVRVPAGGRFRVGEVRTDAPVLDLLQGDLLLKLDRLPPSTQLKVKTPTGVAGVEGTAFRVGAAQNQTTAVEVVAGKVRLECPGEADKFTTVAANQRAETAPWKDAVLRVTGTAAPGDLAEVPVEEKGAPTVVATASALIPTGTTSADESERIAEAQARAAALLDLAERLARRKISDDETLGGFILAREGTVRKVVDYAAGAKTVERRKTDDGRLTVTLELSLAGLRDLVGPGAGAFARSIREVTKAEYGRAFGGQRRLMAEGAARIDAQRKLVEKVNGVLIDSKTTVQDLAAASDVVRVRTQGMVKGFKVTATRYLSDGTIEMDLEISGPECVSALDPKQEGLLGAAYLSRPSPAGLDLHLRFGGLLD